MNPYPYVEKQDYIRNHVLNSERELHPSLDKYYKEIEKTSGVDMSTTKDLEKLENQRIDKLVLQEYNAALAEGSGSAVLNPQRIRNQDYYDRMSDVDLKFCDKSKKEVKEAKSHLLKIKRIYRDNYDKFYDIK